MDLIERLFGVSPDGGSGVTEACYIVAVALTAIVAYFRRPIVRAVRRLLASVFSKRA